MGKRTDKFRSLNEFAYNNSYQAKGHPHFYFGEDDNFYYSYGMTTTPIKKHKYIKLLKNPNPSDKATTDPVFLRTYYYMTKKKPQGEKWFTGWRFSLFDKAAVRRMVKRDRKKIKHYIFKNAKKKR